MVGSNYVKAQQYEGFIKGCRGCNRDEFGANDGLMKILLDKKECTEKDLKEVKKYMNSAVKFAIKNKVPKDDKPTFENYLLQIQQAVTAEHLAVICDEGSLLLKK